MLRDRGARQCDSFRTRNLRLSEVINDKVLSWKNNLEWSASCRYTTMPRPQHESTKRADGRICEPSAYHNSTTVRSCQRHTPDSLTKHNV